MSRLQGSDLKYELQALSERPDGYYRITCGELAPDDLVWSVMEKIWRRADDPTWMHPATDAENVTCAMRKARHAAASGQSTRTYQIPRTQEKPPAVSDERPTEPTQSTLF